MPVYSVSEHGLVAILHIDFTPPLSQDCLLTPVRTKSNEFSGLYCLQNCIDAITEIFGLTPKIRKKTTVSVSFFLFFSFFLSGIFSPFSGTEYMLS